MPLFIYQGTTPQGLRQQGEVVAKDHREAVRLLRSRHVAVIRLREKTRNVSGWIPFHLGRRITTKDLVVFTYQFATMIKAGIPLVSCLEMLATHVSHSRLRATLDDVRQRVENGSRLADAMRHHRGVFPASYVGMVEAGETSGRLDRILTRLAQHQQHVLHLTNQVRGALAYPLTIVCLATLVLIFLLGWVIPIFRDIFSDFGDSLPWPTALVLEASQGLSTHVWWFLTFLGLVVFGGKWLSTTRIGKRYADHLALQAPIVGDLLRKTAVVRISRTLGSLLRSGVPILDSLDLAARASGNVILEQALVETRASVREGSPVADPLSQSGVFPPMVTHMISVGEATGALDGMLEHIADLYEQEVEGALATFTSFIEPAVMVVLGVGIGFIVIAMYLPIFTMSSTLL